jgi:hypothetical protein
VIVFTDHETIAVAMSYSRIFPSNSAFDYRLRYLLSHAPRLTTVFDSFFFFSYRYSGSSNTADVEYDFLTNSFCS